MLNKHKKFLLAFVLIMIAISLVACSKNTNQSIKKADDKLNVVVTNSILADMTKNILQR